LKPRHKRAVLIVVALVAVAIAVGLILKAFRSNIVFFYTPSQVASKDAPIGHSFRIGGMVKEGSLKRDGLNVHFVVTDFAQSVPVTYKGILPDLFKEGKGVVAEGELENDGVFQATEVLAKHDANYMPPEAADALKKAQQSGAATGKSLIIPPGEK
jgi:cytochrome c-type biogenesis protein CcmE